MKMWYLYTICTQKKNFFIIGFIFVSHAKSPAGLIIIKCPFSNCRNFIVAEIYLFQFLAFLKSADTNIL